MDETREDHNEVIEDSDLEAVNRINRPSLLDRWLRTGLSILIISILPNYVTSTDFECGINRFNNESPLTERIVGGNNSLQ